MNFRYIKKESSFKNRDLCGKTRNAKDPDFVEVHFVDENILEKKKLRLKITEFMEKSVKPIGRMARVIQEERMMSNVINLNKIIIMFNKAMNAFKAHDYNDQDFVLLEQYQAMWEFLKKWKEKMEKSYLPGFRSDIYEEVETLFNITKSFLKTKSQDLKLISDRSPVFTIDESQDYNNKDKNNKDKKNKNNNNLNNPTLNNSTLNNPTLNNPTLNNSNSDNTKNPDEDLYMTKAEKEMKEFYVINKHNIYEIDIIAKEFHAMKRILKELDNVEDMSLALLFSSLKKNIFYSQNIHKSLKTLPFRIELKVMEPNEIRKYKDIIEKAEIYINTYGSRQFDCKKTNTFDIATVGSNGKYLYYKKDFLPSKMIRHLWNAIKEGEKRIEQKWISQINIGKFLHDLNLKAELILPVLLSVSPVEVFSWLKQNKLDRIAINKELEKEKEQQRKSFFESSEDAPFFEEPNC